MPDIPEPAIEAAADAIMSAGNFNDDEPERFEARTLARAALEAAAPLLAEVWGVTAARKPGRTRDERAGVTCRRCGAGPGQQCIASSGTRAPMVHAERRNDWRRAGGQTTGLEAEGMLLDRFPPPAASVPVTPEGEDGGS